MADLKPITIEQIQQNPVLNSLFAPYLSPGVQLQQQQAQVPLTQAEAQKAQITVPEAQASTQITEQQAAANNYINQTKAEFQKIKDKQGYVPPSVYNQAKQNKPVGLSDSTFDNNFASSYTDPTQQYNYNTGQGFALRQQRGNIISQINNTVSNLTKEYNSFNAKGPIEGQLANNPLYKYMGLGGSQRTFEQNKAAAINTLQTIAQNKNLAALGIKKEDINNLIANLPSVSDTSGDTSSKAQQMNQALSALGNKPENPQNPGALAQGGKLLQGMLGDILNPQINAYNKAISGASQQSQVQGENPVLKALNMTSAEAKGISSAIPSDIATAATVEAPAVLKNTLGKVLSPFMSKPLESADAREGLSTLQKMLKYPLTTAGKEYSKIEGAVADASKAGNKLSWDNIVKNATERVANMGKETQTALKKLLNENAPAQINNRTLNPWEGLELRKGLGQRLPSNMFETALQKSSTGKYVPLNNAIKALRGAVSDELKSVAPNIKTPDQMYAFIKTMKGDAPTWAKRIIGGYAAEQIAQKLGVKGEGADLISTILGVGLGNML